MWGRGPQFVGPSEEISTYLLSCNRNKESVALDSSPRQADRFSSARFATVASLWRTSVPAASTDSASLWGVCSRSTRASYSLRSPGSATLRLKVDAPAAARSLKVTLVV